MIENFKKYKQVYSHIWSTYGSSWAVRRSYILQVISRSCKLIALPIALSLIIAGISTQNYAAAYQAVVLFAVFSICIGVLSPLSKYIGMLGENKAYERSIGAYFNKLVHTDIDYFNSNQSGYLTTATRQYADSCIELVRTLRDRNIGTLLSILFPLLVIAWIDVWLGLAALCLSIVQAAYVIWASHAINPIRTRSRELYRKNSGRMADIISNILAVRVAAQEAAYAKQIKNDAKQETHVFTLRFMLQSKLAAMREVITVIFFVILLWLTVVRVASGSVDTVAAILIVTYTTTILAAIYVLSEELDQHDDLIDKILPAFNILERTNTITDPKNPKKLTRVKGALHIDSISFTYAKQAPIFNDFSLHIPAGQKIGIVGLSGAGKSTLAKLILRFNDVQSGTITIDNTNIRDVAQTNLRQHVAYVAQEPLLFHTSIRDNVLVGNPNATESEVYNALKVAHALTFTQALPEGIDSIVGERGVKLSGGQKQRIAIARAVLQNTPIIILDEATSALDSESEHIIKESFTDIFKGKTAIVIAHRLSTLSAMDRIIVIENGILLEDGTHKQLLAKKGRYATLWQRQLHHKEEIANEPIQLTPKPTPQY